VNLQVWECEGEWSSWGERGEFGWLSEGSSGCWAGEVEAGCLVSLLVYEEELRIW
jgi:hypothetical protein